MKLTEAAKSYLELVYEVKILYIVVERQFNLSSRYLNAQYTLKKPPFINVIIKYFGERFRKNTARAFSRNPQWLSHLPHYTHACAHTQSVNCTPKENCRHKPQEIIWVLPLAPSSRWTPTILLKIPHRKREC